MDKAVLKFELCDCIIDDILRHVSTEIKKYVPCNKLFHIEDRVITVEKIIDAYKGLNFSSKLQAKNQYLNILKKNELWETTQFTCAFSPRYNTENTNSQRIENPDHIPENCIVCISPKEVIITDEDRNIILKLKYKYLASWGVNGDLFVIVKKQDKVFNKMYFESSQSQLFKILMDSYAGIIAGKNILDICFKLLKHVKCLRLYQWLKLKMVNLLDKDNPQFILLMKNNYYIFIFLELFLFVIL